MSFDARMIDSFGSQAMTEANIFHIDVEEHPEDELVWGTIFHSKDPLDLGWLDVVLVVNFKLLQPPEEIFNSALKLVFWDHWDDDIIIGVQFQYVFEEYSEKIRSYIPVFLLHVGRPIAVLL